MRPGGRRLPCYACAHDEFTLVMHGKLEIRLVKPTDPPVPEGKNGAIMLNEPSIGKKMGRVVAGQGHMTLLPRGAAYQFHADKPSVMTIQTIKGDLTIERWAEICQTAV
jgi:hypothetical protein